MIKVYKCRTNTMYINREESNKIIVNLLEKYKINYKVCKSGSYLAKKDNAFSLDIDITGNICFAYEDNCEDFVFKFINEFTSIFKEKLNILYKTTDDFNRQDELELKDNLTLDEIEELLKLRLIYDPDSAELFDKYIELSKRD